MKTAEILQKAIQKQSKNGAENQIAGTGYKNKITAKIQKGDQVVIGQPGYLKQFIVIDKSDIQKESQIVEEVDISRSLRLSSNKINSKNSSMVIDLEKSNEQNSVPTEWENMQGATVEDSAPMGSMDEEDEIQIIEVKKKIAQRGFIDPDMLRHRDPRKKGLVEEILAILEQKQDQRLNLVLDLDETLLNSIWVCPENQQDLKVYRERLKDCIVSTVYKGSDDSQREFLSIIRPHLNEFLTETKKYFKIFIYSHGRREYVMKLLDKLDPNKNIFDLSLVFKNEGQVTPKTQKELKNIIPYYSQQTYDSILRTTIIVDDIYEVWVEDSQKNVVPIKRFQPFHPFLRKNNPCVLTTNHNKEYIRFPKTHQDLFQDVDTSEQSNKYLKSLSRYLSSCALQYYSRRLIKKDASADIREDLVSQKFSTLNSLNINLRFLEDDEIFSVYKYLVLSTGANLSSNSDAKYILVNFNSLEKLKSSIISTKQNHPHSLIVDSRWLIDCFFMNFQLDVTSYIL